MPGQNCESIVKSLPDGIDKVAEMVKCVTDSKAYVPPSLEKTTRCIHCDVPNTGMSCVDKVKLAKLENGKSKNEAKVDHCQAGENIYCFDGIAITRLEGNEVANTQLINYLCSDEVLESGQKMVLGSCNAMEEIKIEGKIHCRCQHQKGDAKMPRAFHCLGL